MNSPLDKDAWNRLLYTEAWKQYCHEDNLGQRRNNLFIGVQAALIALLTLAAKPLLEAQSQMWDVHIHLGMAIFGFLAAIIGGISLALDSHWKAVIETGRAYINIRWCTVLAVETELGFQQYGLASLEHTWRTFSRQYPGKRHQPFPGSDALSSIEVPSLPETSGWSSMHKVVTALQKVHWGIVLAGLLLVALSALVNPARDAG